MKLIYLVTLAVAVAASFVLAVPVADYGDSPAAEPKQDQSIDNGLTTPAFGSPFDNPNPEQLYANAIQTLVGALYPIITGLAELSLLINLTNRDAILQKTIRETIQPVLNLLDNTPANRKLASRTTEALCRPHPCPMAAQAVWNSSLEKCECAGLHHLPLEPEADPLVARSLASRCRPVACPLKARAFWSPMSKECKCPTLPIFPVPDATHFKSLPVSIPESTGVKVSPRDTDGAISTTENLSTITVRSSFDVEEPNHLIKRPEVQEVPGTSVDGPSGLAHHP